MGWIESHLTGLKQFRIWTWTCGGSQVCAVVGFCVIQCGREEFLQRDVVGLVCSILCRCFMGCILAMRNSVEFYPFLPQSWKWKTTPNERKLLLAGPIFHFHDCGRNGNLYIFTPQTHLELKHSVLLVPQHSPWEQDVFFGLKLGWVSDHHTFSGLEKANISASNFFGGKPVIHPLDCSCFNGWTVH